VTVKTGVSERQMLDALFWRYTNLGAGRPTARQPIRRQSRYVMAEHVRDAAGWNAKRTADFIVMDTNPNFTRGLALIGHEVKCSRADWLTEMRHPEKSMPFIDIVDHWWLVVADDSIVKDDELPSTWGLMVKTERGLRPLKVAPRITPIQPPGTTRPDLPRSFVAPFLRGVTRTTENRIRRNRGQEEAVYDYIDEAVAVEAYVDDRLLGPVIPGEFAHEGP
jgi:hypothetical protein